MRASLTLVFVLLVGVLFGNFSCADNADPANQDTSLIGSWILVGYEDLDAGVVENAPDNADEIRIEFSDSLYSGKTGRNDFFGPYRIRRDSLILTALNGTEINESSWGIRFFDSIRESYSLDSDNFEIIFSVNGELLKMEYKTGQALLFEKAK